MDYLNTLHNQTANSDLTAWWTDTAVTSSKQKSDAAHKGGFIRAEPEQYKKVMAICVAGRDEEQVRCRESQGTGICGTSRQHQLETGWISLETMQEKRRAVSIKHACRQ
jgi:hypothetical protein